MINLKRILKDQEKSFSYNCETRIYGKVKILPVIAPLLLHHV